MKIPLTIVSVTKAEPFAIPFLVSMSELAIMLHAQFVIAADGVTAANTLAHTTWRQLPRIITVHSKGYLESVLEQALNNCDGEYILRLDDDERCSPAMVAWLDNQSHLQHPHWKFPRAHLIGDTESVIMHPQLWPDHQTRLSVREMAGGRHWIHCGSPYGGGEEAPCVIEHHKFLVKSYEERLAIAKRYDTVQPGAGTGGMKGFNLPEDAYSDLKIGRLGSGEATEIR
jgi:hypothetical protein